MNWQVPSLWEGAECWILGGGPSIARQFDIPSDVVKAVMARKLPPEAYSPYLSQIHSKHVIGINNAYQIGDWIDIVFFGDCSWHLVHREKLARWPGLKVTCCKKFRRKELLESEGVKYLQKDKNHKDGITRRNGFISWNRNSGASAISLAALMGAKRIILLGFDMRPDTAKGSRATHWHYSHGKPEVAPKKPPYKSHSSGFKRIAIEAKERGIEIINANPDSMLDMFKKAKPKDLI